MTRILELFEPPDGGVPEHVLQLALGLGEHGFEVELAGPISSQIYARANRSGIKVNRVSLCRDYRHPHQDARATASLFNLLRSGNYQLVHCHASKAGALGRLAAKVASVPAIYTPHCFGFVGEVGRGRQIAARTIERTLAPLTSRIVCVCRDEVRVALEARIASPELLELIYYGVPASHDHPPRDQALEGLRGDGPLIANIGVLRRQKRHDVFLHAAALALRRDSALRISLIGKGPSETELRALAKELGLDAEPRFAFLPFEPPVERYLAAIDAIVLCSDWEALPISLLEALAWGVPQVATSVSGVPEIVTPDTGILVPPGDAETLADAMLKIARDRDLAALSLASRNRYAALFTLERMRAATADVYRQALSAVPEPHHFADRAGDDP